MKRVIIRRAVSGESRIEFQIEYVPAIRTDSQVDLSYGSADCLFPGMPEDITVYRYLFHRYQGIDFL